MNRKATFLVYIFLLLAFLTGCSKNKEFMDKSAPQKHEAPQSMSDAQTAIQPVKDAEGERIYLWKEGNIPTTTKYTENKNSQYADPPNFRPYMTEIG